MSIRPMEFVFDLTSKKKNLLAADPDNIKDYNPFVINMALSMNVETLLHANEMNKRPSMSKQMQHDFLFHGIPKRFRKFPWKKKVSIEDVDLIRKYFECSVSKAQDYLRLLSKADIEEIRNYYYEGGVQ